MPPFITRSVLHVQRLDDAPESWDPLVLGDEDATFCHLSGWRDIFDGILGHEPIYLVARDEEGCCRGVLPLVRMRSHLTGHHLISLPFLNYGGPLGSGSARRALLDATLREARRLHVDGVEIRTRSGLDPATPGCAGLGIRQSKVAVLLDLPSTPEVLWNDRFRSKLRCQIRRPQKEGLEARFGPDQLEAFYRVFGRNMRDLGTPVHPRAWFEQIIRRFGPMVVLAAVYRGELPVAAGFGFLWRGEFEITWASSLREHSAVAPNMLLYWAMMEHVIGLGARTFNFGRSTPGAPTHRFKQQWGGRDVPLPWLRWPVPGPAEAEGDRAPSRSMRMASAAWQRLPLTVANRLGPVLARRLPWF